MLLVRRNSPVSVSGSPFRPRSFHPVAFFVIESRCSVKRFRWSAVLVALALMLSWASAAQATQPSDEGGTTTTSTSTSTSTTTTTTAPKPEEPRFCDPAEGVVSHTGISLDTAGAHPSASASFTIKEGCRVLVALASFDLNSQSDEPFDIDPPLSTEDPFSGPGEHTLKVDLPPCTQFDVVFVAFPAPPEGEAPSADLKQLTRAMASADQQSQEPTVLDEKDGQTTNCPTTTGGGQLPFTGSSGSLPLLIAALIMVIGGAAALVAGRVRGRRAR
jgi:hypothetical protein